MLTDRGRKVAVIEGERVGRGVTGRSTAKVAAQHGTFLQRIEDQHGVDAARDYAAANLAGVDLVVELVRRHGLRCDLEPADSYVYATTDEGTHKLERERDCAVRAGLPMEIVQSTELPYPLRSALLLGRQAQFQPAEFVAELAQTLAGDGCLVFENSRAIDWDETSVQTAGGCVRAQKVIMATHLPLGAVGQYFSNTHPHMHAIVALPVEDSRAPHGMYISIDQPKRSLRRHRGADGQTMLILTGPTYKHGDVSGEQNAFEELEGFARDHFGWTSGGFRWTNEDYAPRDGLPYVGWSGPEGKSLLVATGFDAWGLSNGAAAGLMLADLCDGRGSPSLGSFDASRHSAKGLGKMAADGLQVARDLAGGHLLKHRADGPLAEGAIVDIDGRAAGIYRDDSGSVRAVSAVCTHMGCMLGWNPVDRSWDCPCHGSRFAADGRVLHGPAVEPLGTIDKSIGGGE